MRRIAIKSGIDWTEASVEFVNIPDDADLEELNKQYMQHRKLYHEACRSWLERYPKYYEQMPEEPYPVSLDFSKWLLTYVPGVTESDVEEYWEDMF